MVYPCCCSLLAKVFSLAGRPPEPPRKSSTCTRPMLPIPTQQTHECKSKMNNQMWIILCLTQTSLCKLDHQDDPIRTGWISSRVSVTWSECITACHESSPAWSAERSSCNVLSQLHPFWSQSVYVRSPIGRRKRGGGREHAHAHIQSDWQHICLVLPDGIITIAPYITDTQVIHHHQDNVGLPVHLFPRDISSCCQEQG